MKKKQAMTALLVVLALLLLYSGYLFLHDPGIPVGTWVPDEAFSVTNDQSARVDASALHYLDIAPYKNPETIQLHDGWLYAAVDGGTIIRLHEDGTGLENVLSTGGAILGFDFDEQGCLYFCDAGNSAVCRFDGQTIQNLPSEGLTYPDALCIDDKNQVLYYSDASCIRPKEYGGSPLAAYMVDMMAHTNTGRIVAYDLKTGQQRIVSLGFSFANGLQLTEDGEALLLNETSENRIWRIEIASGEKTLLLTVPGYPDNLHRAESGYWSGLSGSYASSYANLSDKLFLRRAIVNLPHFVFTGMARSSGGGEAVMVQYRSDGTICQYLVLENVGFTVTGVVETADRIYLESISNLDRIAYLEK